MAETRGLKPAELLKGKQAVLFDLDGTLVDSMWMWKDIDIAYLGRYGIALPENLQKTIEGMSFTETAVYFKETWNLPRSVEEIKADWIAMSLKKYQEEVTLKPFALPFLRYLRDNGIRTGIATSNGREMAEGCLRALGVRSLIDVLATGCEVAHGKPAPDIYLYVAEKLETKPQACLVFEDVPAGIAAGRAAGMTVCAVQDAFSAGMEAEKRALSDCFIEDYSEVMP